MTISSTTRTAGPFTGNGVTVAFPFTFKVFTAADLQVVQAVTATGVETTKTLTTDYTVSLNADQANNPGGTVTMIVAPPTGTTLVMTSTVANLQPTDLTNLGGFYPTVINDSLDRLTILVQQLASKIGRSLQLTLTQAAAGISAILPTPSASTLLGWNAAGTALENKSLTDVATSVAYAAARTDIFSGTGAQTAFTLTNDPGSVNNCDVIVGTTPMKPGIDFTVSAKVITFTAAPASGTNNISVRYANALTAIPAGAYSGSSRTVPVSYAYAATVTVDASLSNVFYIGALTGPLTLAISNPADGQTINIRFVQDATGGRTVTLPGSVSVVGALITTASYVDWLTLTYVAASSRWEGCWANTIVSPSAFGVSLIGAADAAAGRTVMGATATGSSLLTAADAAAARTAIGATATGSSLVTAATAAAARTAIGSTATGDAVFVAANTAAARTAIGLNAFSAYINASQSIPNTTVTKVAFNAEDFDFNGFYDSLTNYRFQPTIAGYYQINFTVYFPTGTIGVKAFLSKNGVAIRNADAVLNSTTYTMVQISTIVQMNGSTEYLEVFVQQISGAAMSIVGSGSNGYTNFSGALIA